MLSYQSKVVQFKVGWLVTFSKCMIFKSCLLFFFCENHFLENVHLGLNFFLQSRSKFQTLLRHHISPILVGDSILRREWKLCKFCRKKIGVRVQKCHLCSFWKGGDHLLGHLDGGPSLGESLKPLESVVDENPVLVRLTRVVIWRGGWKWESEILVKVIFQV